MAKGLSSLSVEKAQPGSARREMPDGHLRGLRLIIQPSGIKSFAVRYRFNGKSRKHTLGRYPQCSLKDARQLGMEALRLVALGHDPGQERTQARAKSQTNMVGDAISDFIERHAKAKNRNSTWRETQRILKGEVAMAWGSRGVATITKQDVLNLLDGIVDRGKPVMANRTHAAIRRFFNWCMERGILERSPCDRVKVPASERSRDRVLNDAELAAIWNGCVQIGGPYGRMVQMLMLTGQRRDEVARATWGEVDLKLKLWTLPKERVKNKSTHEVPLTEAVVGLLASLARLPVSPGRPDFIFTTNGKNSICNFSYQKKRLDKILNSSQGVTGKWTLHDLRRTMATGMSRLGVQLPVIEKVVNHLSGSLGGVAGIYQRYSFAAEKREALEKWSQFIRKLIVQ